MCRRQHGAAADHGYPCRVNSGSILLEFYRHATVTQALGRNISSTIHTLTFFYIHGSVHRESNFLYFVVYNLKILLLTIHYFIYILFVKASNIQYDQSRILNYTLVLIAAYFTHCS